MRSTSQCKTIIRPAYKTSTTNERKKKKDQTSYRMKYNLYFNCHSTRHDHTAASTNNWTEPNKSHTWLFPVPSYIISYFTLFFASLPCVFSFAIRRWATIPNSPLDSFPKHSVAPTNSNIVSVNRVSLRLSGFATASTHPHTHTHSRSYGNRL